MTNRPLFAYARRAVGRVRVGLIRIVLARIVLVQIILTACILATAAQAQERATPDEAVLARLVWSTLVALDNANRTGDYSVLHALGSPQMQAATSVEDLAASFAPLREQRVDVGRALLASPTYYIPPGFTEAGALRLRGGFDFRPVSLRFDILFVETGGGWRIDALSVAEMAFDAPR